MMRWNIRSCCQVMQFGLDLASWTTRSYDIFALPKPLLTLYLLASGSFQQIVAYTAEMSHWLWCCLGYLRRWYSNRNNILYWFPKSSRQHQSWLVLDSEIDKCHVGSKWNTVACSSIPHLLTKEAQLLQECPWCLHFSVFPWSALQVHIIHSK